MGYLQGPHPLLGDFAPVAAAHQVGGTLVTPAHSRLPQSGRSNSSLGIWNKAWGAMISLQGQRELQSCRTGAAMCMPKFGSASVNGRSRQKTPGVLPRGGRSGNSKVADSQPLWRPASLTEPWVPRSTPVPFPINYFSDELA